MEVDLFKDGLLYYSRPAAAALDGKDIVVEAQRELKLLDKDLNDDEKPLSVLFYGPREMGRFFKYQGKGDGYDIYRPDFSGEQVPLYELMPAYGGALKAIRKMPANINLLPRRLRKKPSRAGYYTMTVLGILLVLSFISWGWGKASCISGWSWIV